MNHAPIRRQTDVFAAGVTPLESVFPRLGAGVTLVTPPGEPSIRKYCGSPGQTLTARNAINSVKQTLALSHENKHQQIPKTLKVVTLEDSELTLGCSTY